MNGFYHHLHLHKTWLQISPYIFDYLVYFLIFKHVLVAMNIFSFLPTHKLQIWASRLLTLSEAHGVAVRLGSQDHARGAEGSEEVHLATLQSDVKRQQWRPEISKPA